MQTVNPIGKSEHVPTALRPLIVALAEVGAELARTIQRGPLGGALGQEVGTNLGGDGQKALDIMADAAFAARLKLASVRWYASEEQDEVIELDPAFADELSAAGVDWIKKTAAAQKEAGNGQMSEILDDYLAYEDRWKAESGYLIRNGQ